MYLFSPLSNKNRFNKGEEYSTQILNRLGSNYLWKTVAPSSPNPVAPVYPYLHTPSFTESGMVAVGGEIFIGFGFVGAGKGNHKFEYKTINI
jgi:hypothetical protein